MRDVEDEDEDWNDGIKRMDKDVDLNEGKRGYRQS